MSQEKLILAEIRIEVTEESEGNLRFHTVTELDELAHTKVKGLQIVIDSLKNTIDALNQKQKELSEK
jgi:hypothetical protein